MTMKDNLEVTFWVHFINLKQHKYLVHFINLKQHKYLVHFINLKQHKYVGRDWAQSGVAQLFTKIRANGYHIMYLSARAIGQASITKEYLQSVKQVL